VVFLEWACENKLPVSCRNQNLLPNLIAYTSDKEVWQKCADIQEKELKEFEEWAKRKTTFNCEQLRHYAEKLGLGKYCEICLEEMI